METETNNNQTNNDPNDMNEVNTNEANGTQMKKARKAQRPAKARKERKARKAKPAAPAPVLEFAEPDKTGWRYAEGRSTRFAVGASRHHGADFALYSRTPDMSRFKLIGKFESFEKAQSAAEKEESLAAAAATEPANSNPF